MSEAGIVKYDLSTGFNFVYNAFKFDLRPLKRMKACFSIPYHKNVKNELFWSFARYGVLIIKKAVEKSRKMLPFKELCSLQKFNKS